MTRSFYARVLGGTAVALALSVPSAQAQDAARVRQLEQMIQQQQQMLNDMKTQLDALQNATIQSKAAADAAAAKADAALKETEAAPTKLVSSGRERVKLSISGQVNRAALITGDGENTEVFHVDNDHSSTRVRFVGEGKPADDLSVGAQIEVEMESNSSAAVSQATENTATGGASFTERKLELFLKHKRLGNLWVGQGDTASNETAEVDLSGTTLIAKSEIQAMAGGMFFRASTGALTGVRIRDVYDHLDGASRQDRIRYDTPSFMGFAASASHAQGGINDYALRYSAKWGGFATAAALGYVDFSSVGTTDSRLAGSGSVLHEPTGVSLTLAAGQDDFEVPGRANAVFWYGKLGYQRQFFGFGKTYTAVDFGHDKNEGQNDDEFTTLGIGLTQKIDAWGTELYGGYRWHHLNRSALDLDDINAGMVGARIKF